MHVGTDVSEKIRVDIWSDIACPWCYVGKHRFEAGVAAFQANNPDVAFEVESHSFELAPDTPLDFVGNEIDFLVKHKGMPRESVEGMLGQMTGLGEDEGITFNFGDIQHVNTARAHRALHFAKENGLQHELLERLFRAYFTDGENLSDVDVIARLASEVGLDADGVRAALNDEAYAEKVEADITRARMLGANGVPFFLINQKYGISGAQAADAFAGAFEQVMQLERDAQ